MPALHTHSYDQEDSMRMEHGYPVKTFYPGTMIPLDTVRSTRLRPSTAPAKGSLTMGKTRSQRTESSYNKMVNFLDKTGRLHVPAARASRDKPFDQTARPTMGMPFMDNSPEALQERLAWAQYMRYRSEYQVSGKPCFEMAFCAGALFHFDVLSIGTYHDLWPLNLA